MQKKCYLCPRECGADRKNGETGVCGQTGQLKAARAALHFWEEPCISGTKGSGAVFFSGCALHCVYCQNRSIAEGNVGKQIRMERLSDIFTELMEQGAHNINLVTPGHFVPQIKEALILAKKKGMNLPIIYNTGGYEKTETLETLNGLIDVYLPDFKYMDTRLAARYSHAPDYPKIAKAAIAEMVRQTGPCIFSKEGLILRGTIVRHLLLPGCLSDSKEIIRYLYETFGDTIYLSIMNQFTPVEIPKAYSELARKTTEEEYEELVDYAISIGVENGYIQEGETAKESFIPQFDNKGI